MKPKGLMVWCGVGFNAKAPLIFVRAGVKISTDVYRTEILEPVEQWAEGHYGVDEGGKFFECFRSLTCFQDFGMSGAFSKMAPRLTQAQTIIRTDSRFQLNDGSTSIFQILSTRINGRQHLPT